MFKYFIIAILFSYSSLINGQDSLLLNDTIISNELKQASADTLVIIDDTELFVSFPGGTNAFNEYLKTNLVYPDSALNFGLSGRVVVSFLIDSLGKISNIKIERGDYSPLNREVVRFISTMPNWIWDKRIPIKNRKLTKRTLPFDFNFDENKNKPSR